jgi:predicted ATPase
MITNIKIERFRGIKEGELSNLTPLTVLVGPNGSGKSSLLEAMLIGASKNPIRQMEAIVNHRRVVQNAHQWLMWKRGLDGGASLVTHFKNKVPQKRVCLIELGKTDFELIYSEAGKGDKGKFSLNCSRDNLSSPIRITPHLQYPENAEGIEGIILIKAYAESTISMEDLYFKLRDDGYGKLLNDIVREVIPSLDVVEILAYQGVPVLRTSYADRSVPVAFAGDGIYALIRFVMEFVTAKDGVVLVEEPETHQHYRTIALSAKAIWEAVRRGIQVILTTHSMEFLDALIDTQPDEMDKNTLSLYSVILKEGILHPYRYDGTQVEFARQTLEEDLR